MLPSFDDQFAAIKNNGTSFPNVTLFVQKDMGVMCKIGEMIRNGYQNKAWSWKWHVFIEMYFLYAFWLG